MNNYKSLSMLALAGALVFTGCGEGSDKKAELAKLKKQQSELNGKIKDLETELGKSDTTAVQKLRYVQVTPVAPTSFKHYIDIQGKVDAMENVSVSAQTPGTVLNISAVVGQRVNKGQVLAQQDNAVLRSSIEELKSNLELANTVYERQKSLWDQKIGTEVQFLQAKNGMDNLERKLATLNQQVAQTRIISPISGTIDEVIVKVGDVASPGMPAFRIVNTTKLKAIASVSESYAGNVKVGDEVMILFPDINKEQVSKVSFVSHAIDPVTRSFVVESKLPSDPVYRSNMVAVMKIVDYSANNAIVVPINAVQKVNNETFVLTAETLNGKEVAKKKPVKLGRIYGTGAEVLTGLTAGEKLVIVGYQGLNEGEVLKY